MALSFKARRCSGFSPARNGCALMALSKACVAAVSGFGNCGFMAAAIGALCAPGFVDRVWILSSRKAKSKTLLFRLDTKGGANVLGRQHARGGFDHLIEVVLGQIESF